MSRASRENRNEGDEDRSELSQGSLLRLMEPFFCLFLEDPGGRVEAEQARALDPLEAG